MISPNEKNIDETEEKQRSWTGAYDEPLVRDMYEAGLPIRDHVFKRPPEIPLRGSSEESVRIHGMEIMEKAINRRMTWESEFHHTGGI